VIDLVTIVGARPQFVKAAAVSRAIAKHGGIAERIVHTGQHHDDAMSDIFFRELEIPAPAINLGIAGGGHGTMTGRMLAAIEGVLTDKRPDAILVYGDTNSTLAGALAAAKLDIPVVHVEAGLRSYRRAMPEEINRVLTDRLSALLLCPTRSSIENLAREGIVKGCHHVGDVMYDATLHARTQAMRQSDILTRLGLAPGGYSVATLHRAENTDDRGRLAQLIEFMRREGRDHAVVLPLHPRTAKAAAAAGLSFDGLIVEPPLGYLDMHRLLADATLVMTDSGGLQKEAYFHQVPCITLRDETEWVETVEAGWNRLWEGPDFRPRRAIDDYGSGDAAGMVVARIAAAFG
jgi:UDP-GlcNAc3NAcA epimerase